jgi:hypothetical protein
MITHPRPPQAAWGAPDRAGARPLEAAIGGGAAAVVAGLAMVALRSALQVRTLPERLMEWLLLFISPDLFEAILRRFGFDAKRSALDAAVLVMLVLLGALGYLVLRRGWSVPIIALVGLGFWLFVMLVIMPLTAAGVFAKETCSRASGRPSAGTWRSG